MSIAIMSDLHANLEAAEAVFRDRDSLNRQGRGITKTYCLGDLVDYGSNPREVIELVRRECDVVVAGNHDIDVSRRKLRTVFYHSCPNGLDSETMDISQWTRKQLSGKHKKVEYLKYLTNLPLIHKEDSLTFVHGAPLNGFYPFIYFSRDHIPDFLAAAEVDYDTFLDDVFKGVGKLCFIGHTHVPNVTTLTGDRNVSMRYVDGSQPIPLQSAQKAIVNVGSVGQPRDMDWRACYVILDGETVEFRRVDYDNKETLRKIKEAGIVDGRYLQYYGR